MGNGASAASYQLPLFSSIELHQKEDIDEGALVVEIKLELMEDPSYLPQQYYIVSSKLFNASMQLAHKHGGLTAPITVEWSRDEMIFVVSKEGLLIAQVPCQAILPPTVDPMDVKWANACLKVSCESLDEDLIGSISYLRAKPRTTKKKKPHTFATEETAALLNAYFAVSRRLKRLVCLSSDLSNESNILHWCIELTNSCEGTVAFAALHFLLSRVHRKLPLPALDLRPLLARLRASAEAGDVDAQLLLSQVLFLGMGVAKDESEAIKWTISAAEQGSVKALVAYARALLIGRHGLRKDTDLAMEKLQVAANADDSEAQTLLGLCYTSKQLPQELELLEAVRLFTRAADNGHTTAKVKLAHCLLSGRGVDQDEVKAMELYQQAAEAGNNEAQCSLGVLLAAKGDAMNAELWFKRAADQGNLEAAAQLSALKSGSCVIS